LVKKQITQEYDLMNENNIKHLELIQSNIARMNQNSFQMKGWAIAILSALLAIFAASVDDNGHGNVSFIFIAIVPTIIFWLLDSYYLQQERKFIGIYNDIACLTEEPKRIDVRKFEMPLDKYVGCKYCFFRVIWSKTEWPLYLTIILGLIIVGFVLK
jgi:hypothetical protein